MRNRWPTAVFTLVAVLLVAYFSANTSVQAQNTSLPFVEGETVTLKFAKDLSLVVAGSHTCTVADVRGTFVRCAAAPQVAFVKQEMWFNMQSVVAFVVER